LKSLTPLDLLLLAALGGGVVLVIVSLFLKVDAARVFVIAGPALAAILLLVIYRLLSTHSR